MLQGLGSAVSRILGKDVAAADPVLAKRKTPMMREIDEERAARKQQKQRRLEKAERRAVLAAPAGDEEAVREKVVRRRLLLWSLFVGVYEIAPPARVEVGC